MSITKYNFNFAVNKLSDAYKKNGKHYDHLVTLFDVAAALSGSKKLVSEKDLRSFMAKNKSLPTVAWLNDYLFDNWVKKSGSSIAPGKYYEHKMNIETALPEFEVVQTMVDFQQAVEVKFTINQGESTDIDSEIGDYLDEMDNLEDTEEM